MGGNKGTAVKNPARWTILNESMCLGAIRGYAGVTATSSEDLSYDQFMERVELVVDKPGHPLFRPFMVRRYGANVGLPVQSPLAYDHATARWWAFQQLQENMRVMAAGSYTLLDELNAGVGDTIAMEDASMGVRRMFLVDGEKETKSGGVTLNIIDVIGG